jgi:hypothetical protein
LQGIPYILGAIDGFHIPFVAPKADPKSYYCQERFHSTLIQRILDAKCNFWDYDYGWARSINDGVFFQKINIGSCVKRTIFYLIS